jgi:hypothetical protein
MAFYKNKYRRLNQIYHGETSAFEAQVNVIQELSVCNDHELSAMVCICPNVPAAGQIRQFVMHYKFL